MTSRLSRFEEFARLARHEGVDVRPTLLRVLTDFYVQQPTHTPEEEQHFTALALRLIDEVDARTKSVVADKLRAYAGTPAAVLAKLGGSSGAPTRQPGQSAATATRDKPHSQVSDTDRAAAARFSDMFFQGTAEQRRALLHELASGATAAPRAVAADAAAAATGRLEAAALRGRPFEFVCEVERALGVPRAYAEAIINDASGEAMLVMAKALGMPSEVLQRLLLLVNPLIGSSVRRVFELCALYEELSAQAALRMVSLWRNARPPQKVAHRPPQPADQWRDPRAAAAEPATAPARAGSKPQRAS